MNKKMTDYVIDLVEVLNKQQKQVFCSHNTEGFAKKLNIILFRLLRVA